MNNKRINFVIDLTRMALILLITVALVFVIVFLTSAEPLVAIQSFFFGPFTSIRRLGNIVEAASPLMFTSLAVIIIFRSGLFSMISEGSFFIGITGAMIIGIACPLPAGIHPATAILFGGICGALIALIPALLRMKWNVSEVVTSIMLNYVVQFFAIYMVSYHFRELSSSSLASLLLLDSSKLPVLIDGTRVHAGVIIALILCVLIHFLLQNTTLGLKIRVVGDNQHFAFYTGINSRVIMVYAQLIAGFIAGIGGAVELLGMYTRFKWTSTPGYGWTGIVVALLAKNNPLLVPPAAVFIAYMGLGADIMARSSDVSREVVDIIQGVMMLLIAAESLLYGWRQRLIVQAAKEEERLLMEKEQALLLAAGHSGKGMD